MPKFPAFLCLLFFYSQTPLAQNLHFTEALLSSSRPRLPIDIEPGNILPIDLENDGDMDLITFGRIKPNVYSHAIYENNGQSSFTLKEKLPFGAVDHLRIAAADINGDGFKDIFINGRDGTDSSPIHAFYLNNGSGDFVLLSSPNLLANHIDQIENFVFRDMDNDGDRDIITIGKRANLPVTLLLTNNGFGLFTPVPNTSFMKPISNSLIRVFDLDGDKDMDVIIAGKINHQDFVIEVYENHGQGSLSRISVTSVENWNQPQAFQFLDLDNDNDIDAYIEGYDTAGTFQKNILINDGIGNFTSKPSPLPNSALGLFGDVDMDGDPDVLSSQFQIYINDGNANFSQDLTFIHSSFESYVQMVDIDSDQDLDIITINHFNTVFYFNDGKGGFEVSSGLLDHGPGIAKAEFINWDGKGRDGILAFGPMSTFNGTNPQFTQLTYNNDGFGQYQQVPKVKLFPHAMPGFPPYAIGDIDNDGLLDCIAGTLEAGTPTRIYHNLGNNNFSVITDTAFLNLQEGAISLADLDGDGDLDVIRNGRTANPAQHFTQVYLNLGMNGFIRSNSVNFNRFPAHKILADDIDGDLDVDLILVGRNQSEIYLNDGSANFTLKSNTALKGYNSNVGNADLIDIDNDSIKDFIITGENHLSANTQEAYINDGSGNFTPSNLLSGLGFQINSFGFGDLDGNSYKDLIALGREASGLPVTKVYLKDSTGSFNFYSGDLFDAFGEGFIDFSDIDGDDDIDVLISSSGKAKLYRNGECFSVLKALDTCAPGFTWHNGVTYTKSDTLRHKFQTLSGCDSLVTLYLDLTYLSSNILKRDSFLYAEDSTASYQWLVCSNGFIPYPGETGRTFKPPMNGSYAVAISKNGCTDTSACFLVQDVSLKEETLKQDIRIFPNPTEEIVTIEVDAKYRNETMEIEVFNSVGQRVQHLSRPYQKRQNISLAGTYGVYFIKIKTDSDYLGQFTVVKQ